MSDDQEEEFDFVKELLSRSFAIVLGFLITLWGSHGPLKALGFGLLAIPVSLVIGVAYGIVPVIGAIAYVFVSRSTYRWLLERIGVDPLLEWKALVGVGLLVVFVPLGIYNECRGDDDIDALRA